jgi:hypothetical protein
MLYPDYYFGTDEQLKNTLLGKLLLQGNSKGYNLVYTANKFVNKKIMDNF